MIPVIDQILIFSMTIILGVVVGIIFDFYQSFHSYTKPRKTISMLGDFLIWLIAAAVVFYVLLYITWGEVRLFLFIGMGIGYLLYRKAFARYLVFIFDKFFLVMGRIISFLLRIFKKTFYTLLYLPAKKTMIIICKLNIKKNFGKFKKEN